MAFMLYTSDCFKSPPSPLLVRYNGCKITDYVQQSCKLNYGFVKANNKGRFTNQILLLLFSVLRFVVAARGQDVKKRINFCSIIVCGVAIFPAYLER